MKGQVKAASPADYITKLDEPRKTDITALDALIRETAPTLDPHLRAGMLGYGTYHYKYASGREGDWFRVGLASNKAYISLYICAADDRGYVAERYRDKLPNANIGRSCVRFKKLADVDQKVLVAMVKEAVKLGFSM